MHIEFKLFFLNLKKYNYSYDSLKRLMTSEYIHNNLLQFYTSIFVTFIGQDKEKYK